MAPDSVFLDADAAGTDHPLKSKSLGHLFFKPQAKVIISLKSFLNILGRIDCFFFFLNLQFPATFVKALVTLHAFSCHVCPPLLD